MNSHHSRTSVTHTTSSGKINLIPAQPIMGAFYLRRNGAKQFCCTLRDNLVQHTVNSHHSRTSVTHTTSSGKINVIPAQPIMGAFYLRRNGAKQFCCTLRDNLVQHTMNSYLSRTSVTHATSNGKINVIPAQPIMEAFYLRRNGAKQFCCTLRDNLVQHTMNSHHSRTSVTHTTSSGKINVIPAQPIMGAFYLRRNGAKQFCCTLRDNLVQHTMSSHHRRTSVTHTTSSGKINLGRYQTKAW